MYQWLKHLKAIIASLAATVTVVGSPVHAQIISNTAAIEWQVGPTTLVKASNQVDIAVDRATIIPKLSIFQFSSSPGAILLAVPPTMCRTTGGDVRVELEGAFARLSRAPATVEATTRVRAGEPLVIGISAKLAEVKEAERLAPKVAEMIGFPSGVAGRGEDLPILETDEDGGGDGDEVEG